MNVTYSPKARQWGEGYALLQHAMQRLEEVAGPSGVSVSAEWDRGEDERRRTLYTLKIRDLTGEASATFTWDELESKKDMRGRLLHLWGDLLQDRSHKLLKKLTEGNDESEA